MMFPTFSLLVLLPIVALAAPVPTPDGGSAYTGVAGSANGGKSTSGTGLGSGGLLGGGGNKG